MTLISNIISLVIFPQSNGKPENSNKCLKASIWKLYQDDKQGLDQVLSQTLVAYRC